LYKELLHDNKLVENLLTEFNYSDWSKVSDSGNTKASYILQNGIHKIKIESTIKAELFSVLAVVSEVDLYTLWFPLILNLGLKQAT